MAATISSTCSAETSGSEALHVSFSEIWKSQWLTNSLVRGSQYCRMHDTCGPGGRFKNVYELLNLRALEQFIKTVSFNVWVRCLCGITKVPFVHTLKDVHFIPPHPHPLELDPWEWEVCMKFKFQTCNFQTGFSDWWLRHLLWNCPNMSVTELHWWSVNIGSGNGLVPSGNKPLLNH